MSMPAQVITEDSAMARMAVMPKDRVDREAPNSRSPIAKELPEQTMQSMPAVRAKTSLLTISYR
jgi:hypothetical protein